MRKKTINSEELDKLVDEGVSNLREMAELLNVTEEGVRQYLLRTVQHDKFKKRSARRNEMLERLAHNFREIALNKAKESGFAYEKAIECYFSTRYRNSKYLQRLINFFQNYERARDSEEKPSLKELGELYGFCPYCAGRILYRIGLNPFHNKRKKSANPYPTK